MTRLLLVEDNIDLAFGLRNNLEIEGYHVAGAEDGEEGLRCLLEDGPWDVVVLDVMLPKMDGFRVLKMARDAGVDAPVLLLTARGEEADVVRGLRLGADDYVTKPFGILELLARVEALLRRRGAASQSERVLAYGDTEIDLAARTVSYDGDSVALTPKEFDLLVALYRREGAAASRVELIQEVWGYPASVITRTVDTHIAELRAKLESDASEPRHILTVPRVGYRLDQNA
ncbi:MAG: response regulator [Acidobacteria bacterium]|nr:response regulator [Acidobacteriota bacterium]